MNMLSPTLGASCISFPIAKVLIWSDVAPESFCTVPNPKAVESITTELSDKLLPTSVKASSVANESSVKLLPTDFDWVSETPSDSKKNLKIRKKPNLISAMAFLKSIAAIAFLNDTSVTAFLKSIAAMAFLKPTSATDFLKAITDLIIKISS